MVGEGTKVTSGRPVWEEMAPGQVDLSLLRELARQMGRDAWRAVSDEAQVVASYLRCHPRVDEIRYPGLKQDPSFAEAASTLEGGFGPVVDYRLAGEGRWRRLVCEGVDPRATALLLEAELSKA